MVPRATLARAATSRICTASYPPSAARAVAASMTRLRRAAWFLGRVGVSGAPAVEHVIVPAGMAGLRWDDVEARLRALADRPVKRLDPGGPAASFGRSAVLLLV